MADKPVPSYELDAGFPELKRLVIERTGHFYYQDKDDLLWERVRKRLRATGTRDSAQYVERLSDPALGPAEWGRLETEITIGETFFFRYAEQFAALRERILPDLIDRKCAVRRLRVWSAGCATGAEPYSVAILLRQLLGHELDDWRVSIVGTDINEAFLETARKARFGKWALRSLSPEERTSYFLPSSEGNQWQLRPEYRALVRFQRHNLLSLLDGTSPLQFTEFDLVLCRNVLIYFHPDMVARIVGALRDSLDEGGWMLLGHAEPNPLFASLLQVVDLPGTVAYRRRQEGEAPSLPPVVESRAVDGAPSWPAVLPAVPRPAPPGPVTGRDRPSLPRASAPAPGPAPAPPQIASMLAEIRALADAGRFEKADALCRSALTAEPLNPILHYYHGLVAQALKDPGEAEKAFRKGIYLDKSFAMAHYHLGLLLLADGRSGPGRRSMANAARIAAAMPGSTVLDEADGLTAQELRNLVRTHLQAITRSGTRG